MTVRVAFLGDTLLGGVGLDVLDQRGSAYALSGIAPLLAGADLVVANHEGPATDLDVPNAKLDTGRKRYWYRSRPSYLAALRDAGVRVVGLANNHVLDFGPSGLADTVSALDAAGIAHCGAGRDAADARRPVTVEVKGLRFGFLAAMQRYELYVREQGYAGRHRPGPARLRPDRVAGQLDAIDADVKVVLAHWGRNYRAVNPLQHRLAAQIRAAGADLIVGHHPHVPQPVDTTGRAPVLFSLGNGPFGSPGRFHSGRPPFGVVATATFDGPGAPTRLELDLIAVDNAIVDFRPVPVPPAEARAFLRTLAPGGCPSSDTATGIALDLVPGLVSQ